MEKVLHGHLAREVGEHHDAVVGTFLGIGVAQRRHLVGEVHHVVDILDTLAGSGGGGALRDSVDAHVLFASIDVAEGAGDALQHTLGIGHIVVTEEGALRSHVGECYHRTVLGNGVELLGHLKHLVEGDGGDVEGFLEITVIQIVVGAVLAHVGAHTDGVKHKVNLSAQHLHRLFKYLLQVLHTGGICRDDRGTNLLGQLVESAHAQCHRRVAEGNLCAFFGGLFSYFPCNGVFVERAEDDAALAFQ